MANNQNSNDNDSDVMIIIMAVCCSYGIMLAMVVGMVLLGIAIICLLLTLAAIISVWKPIPWGDDIIMWPHQARWFLLFGFLGMLCLPISVTLLAAALEVKARFSTESLNTLLIMGWVGGSMGYMFLTDHEGSLAMCAIREEAQAQQPPPMKEINPPAFDGDVPEIKFRGTLPAPKKPEPFRFASWDDEEEFR